MSTKKELTRQKIISAASKGFRSQGFSGIGVDGIAKEAGVTSGAFYAHLGSKNGAFKAALELGLDEVIDAIPNFQTDFGENWIEEFVNYYLGMKHRKDMENGCAMTSLSPEVARSDIEFRTIYEAKMNKIAELIADGLDGKSKADRTTRSWSLLGVLIGGLTMARAVKSKKIITEISCSIKATAIATAGKVKSC